MAEWKQVETGIAAGITLSDLARPRIRSRSALLVAVAVGVALFVLVAAAFSVAAESRVVATRSNELHGYDEILRNAITARSQLGSALNFAQLDASQGTDSSEIIDRSVADARQSLATLRSVASSLDPGSPAVDPIDAFGDSAVAVAQLLETGTPEDLATARDLVIGPMDAEYDELIAALVDERDRLVEELTTADENLGRLGALATFIIAFFVPTVAMFVYRQVTRRQRETIELARLLSEARTGMEWRTDLVQAAADLAHQETSTLPASTITSAVRSRLRDLEFLVAATSFGHTYTFEQLKVAELRRDLQEAWPAMVTVAGDGADVMWGDRSAVLLLCHDVIRNAAHRGAERVLVSGGTDPDGAWLAITDNGRPLDESAVAAILDTPSLIDASDERRNQRLDADTSIALILGRMVAPALGGSFWCDSVGSNTRFTLRLPLAPTKRSAAPKLTTAR